MKVLVRNDKGAINYFGDVKRLNVELDFIESIDSIYTRYYDKKFQNSRNQELFVGKLAECGTLTTIYERDFNDSPETRLNSYYMEIRLVIDDTFTVTQGVLTDSPQKYLRKLYEEIKTESVELEEDECYVYTKDKFKPFY